MKPSMQRAVLLMLMALAMPGALVPAIAVELPVDELVAARIRSLRPNEALLLGSARVVGDFNEVARRFYLHRTGPRARDFSIKMVWAPERRRVLFVGANHGSPHRLNDVWEFDLAAFAWVLLYPPDQPRSYGGLGDDASDVAFRGGALVTRRGGPAIIAHTWWGVTYDSVRRRMLFMNTWPINQEAAVRQVGGDPTNLYPGPPLWAFNPEDRSWTLVKTEPPVPRAPVGALLEFVPSLGGAIWHMNNWQMRATWLFDGSRWTILVDGDAQKGFAAQAPGRESVGYHDARRNLIVAQWRRSTFHFDIVNRAWTKVGGETKGGVERSPDGHDAYTVLYGDPDSGHGLLVDFRSREIWAYDPDRISWTKQLPQGDPMPNGKRMLSYFDPARRVLVVIDDTKVWVYRYR